MKNKVINTIATLLFTVLIASCGAASNDNKQATNAPVDVKATVLKMGQLNTPVTIPGQLVPYNSVELYARENSYVKTVHADIGATVKKGDLLVTMEAPELVSQYNQAQSDVNTKFAIYTGSRSNYDRLYRTSKTPGTISPNDLDQALARSRADSAQWKAAASAFRQAADLLNYLVIKAPFDGVITARNVSPGAYVGPGDKNAAKPLLVLQEQRKLRLTVNVNEDYAGYMHDQDTVSFTVRGLPGRHFSARISRMAGGVNEQTRTEQVEMDVDNSDHLLLPQMYADVSLLVKESSPGFVVPRAALIANAEKVFVIKIVNKKATWLDVKKVFENATDVTLSGELHKGDTLVTNATDEIREGTVVNVVGN